MAFCSRPIHDGRCCCIHKVATGSTCPACTQPGLVLSAPSQPQQGQPQPLTPLEPIFAGGFNLGGQSVTRGDGLIMPTLVWTYADMTGQQTLTHRCRACGIVDALAPIAFPFTEDVVDRLGDIWQTGINMALSEALNHRAAVAPADTDAPEPADEVAPDNVIDLRPPAPPE
jgi:hypothetical protein